jgi:rhamnose transport system permease protein
MILTRFRREISVAAAYALLLILLLIFAPTFFKGNQFHSILVSSAPIVVAAIGMTLVILARQIDISIGSQFCVCGIAAGLLARSGLPMPAVAIGTVLLGAVFGAVNGAFIAGLGLPSIVVTLATMVILREGLRWWREGEFVRDLPPEFQWFGLGQDRGQMVVVGIALVVFAAFAWGLRNLRAGRTVYATGSDPEAAFLAGIQPRRVTLSVFVAMGALVGLAAMLHSARFAVVDPTAGTGLELAVIAAVVVGGVAISGGRGTLVGPLLGVWLMATIGPALVFFRAEAHWEKALQGAVILLAVAADGFGRVRRPHATV